MPSDFFRAMENLKEYTIRFVSLKDGIHHFDFKVGKEFFDAFEYSEIKEGDVSVDIEMEKSSSMMVFNFTISGEINVECDVCLDPMRVPVNGNFRQIVKLTEEEGDSMDEEMVFLSPSEFEMNVAPFIFEFIHLCIPSKKVHSEGECNEKVKDVLNQYLLSEADENDSSEEIDPRWEALKALKKK